MTDGGQETRAPDQSGPARIWARVRRTIRTLRDERRAYGWKGLLRRRGWKLVLAVILFYLVRDVILYILIPLAIVAGLTD